MKIRNELDETETAIRTYKSRNVVKNFPRYEKTFLSLEKYFKEFWRDFRLGLQKTLPLIRGGDSNETDLTKLVGSYELSVFNKNFIKAFFDARNREVGTIQNVLDRAKNEPSVIVDYGSSSAGNKCLQVRSKKIECTLYIHCTEATQQNHIFVNSYKNRFT